MSEFTEVLAHIIDSALANNGADLTLKWWHHEALDALDAGHYQAIYSRDQADLYLARFWLTPPNTSEEDGHQWDSADSMLLHYILRADDAPDLHCHPWGFRTTVLSGSYDEEVPSDAWMRQIGRPAESSRRWPGPVSRHTIHHPTGSSHSLQCGDLHAIARVEHSTWTLVRTGARNPLGWGFHPAGRLWVDHATYLQRHPGA